MVVIRLFLGALLCACIAPSFAYADKEYSDKKGCHANKPGQTNIIINLTIEENPVYDLSRDIAWLNRDGGKSTTEWLERNGLQSVYSPSQFVTNGQAHGGMGLVSGYSMFSRKYGPYGGYQCPYFREIQIDIFYRTLIYIPNEYPQGSCAFEKIQAHELKHHAVNSSVIKAAVERMRKDLPAVIYEMEGNGYLPHDQIRPHFEKMKAGMRDFIDVYYADLVSQEMKRLNHLVDTPEEYERGGHELRECAKQDRMAQTK